MDVSTFAVQILCDPVYMYVLIVYFGYPEMLWSPVHLRICVLTLHTTTQTHPIPRCDLACKIVSGSLFKQHHRADDEKTDTNPDSTNRGYGGAELSDIENISNIFYIMIVPRTGH